jgi:hypothetical protein
VRERGVGPGRVSLRIHVGLKVHHGRKRNQGNPRLSQM